ncbi:serine/threonine-protein kinase [Archangium lansingense]|uniref:Protein kinase n=1 Tax=Archangium lansingense TaxID=2995310 RepID=A0ABT3ZYW5_9BACT|nr:serine/threonine-protein kinase [Archangium lansinium]MCY1074596.1 protein kinase [Archangium lansinium]
MSLEAYPDERTVVHAAPSELEAGASADSDEPEEVWESTVRKDIMVGQRIGEYVVRRRIGSGGMGVVYEGEHPVIGRKVAIKIIRPDSSEGIRARDLVGEARAVSAIRHRGIIDIFGFGTLPGIGQYLVMEYLNGRPLDEVILDRAPIPPSEAIRLIIEVLGALSAAHAVGVIHRDLKPGNIFVVLESNGSEYVKVLDFGLAKQGATPNGPTPQTRASMIVGTPEYMAPEQACGQPVSPRTDLYAVGIILFEMLTGRLPFRGDSPMHVAIQQVQAQPPSPASLVEGLPPELDDLVLRLLAKEPEQRPASAEALTRELKAIARTLAVDMTQLSGFARAVPEAPEPASRPAPQASAAPPRPARPTAPPPAETVEAPKTIAGSRQALPSPESEAAVAARPAPSARPPAARPQAARPRAAAPRTPPTTDVVPVQGLSRGADVPDTAEIAPVRSGPSMKVWLGVGLAAVLIGGGVGVVALKRDSGQPVPDVSGASASKDPASGTGSAQPPPTPGKEPQGETGAQQAATPSPDAQPKVETPAQPETPPSAQAVAAVEDPASQKTETNSARPDATSGTKRRSPGNETGVLRVVSGCWAKVFIDGKRRGDAPLARLVLPAGQYTLSLLGTNPALKNHREAIVIEAGKTLEYKAPPCK